MADEPHFTLPSSRLLASFHAFYEKATMNKDGTMTVILKAPAEMAESVFALRRQDGLALNIAVWETHMPDGMAELARVVGLADPDT